MRNRILIYIAALLVVPQFAVGQTGEVTEGYEVPIRVENNYLLIPAQDGDPKMWIWIVREGQPVDEPINIRVAHDRIDYWVSVDVSRFRGEEIAVRFQTLDLDGIGYRQIGQGDTFDFSYNEKYRPAYHFSPPFGWTNDPNGLVWLDGEYHLYYQYNPYGTMWGNMHWGHAVTRDLVTWEPLPPAIAPDTLGTIFSGSAVVDRYDTAGFGPDAIVAVYTSAGRLQTQSIAGSTDRGRTFEKYPGNPVLSDPSITDFRDPKVMWYEPESKWVMSLATSHTISFYHSKDLKTWEKTGEFGHDTGAHGGVWECPDLFPLPYEGQMKWVLLVSSNPGGPDGVNSTQYFIGDFDGRTFTADPLPYPLWIDYGRDNYAGVTWNNAPGGRRLYIGWMSNWDFANFAPTLYFRNAMTLVRELRLADNGRHTVLASYPAAEISSAQGKATKHRDVTVDGSHTIQSLVSANNGAYRLSMEIRPGNAVRFGFSLQNQTGEKLDFMFDTEEETLVIDRTESGLTDFSDNFASVNRAPLVKKDVYSVDLYMDRASSELFLNGGELVSTNVVFPSEPYNTLVFTSSAPVEVKNIQVCKMAP